MAKRRTCEDCSNGSCVNCVCDAQAARIAALERNQVTPAMQAEFETGNAQRDKLRSRIAELEALVLSSDTVAKSEYQQMVEQRDTMRKERNEARFLAQDALGWLQTHDEAACIEELSALIHRLEELESKWGGVQDG